ncbi:fusion of conjugal transfer pilus assembly proteins TraB and TraH (plasmid) [Escherichia coli O83:H1 str. NRG 857C]|uniref:Fusion of conjugal transfer pilus assembly proteins TraB and TraH n=1 Tax=Escherichia coli O83:H1 (strain NRG 857C / AIEC) TaxID=685038 RepID=A0A0H3ERJ3_ECO8N|nr:F-type conjugal transfer pilus assembly protein TraB [Escherichia coli]ADR29955.1 fusion of conjugal transfer pilus assembly proteins TraB and TraH [Escherichia coli O83:H1 str. NRG 857C]
MASINTIVKRKQYLWLGIVVVGTASAIGGALYLSDVDMSGNGETVAEQEPVPDMTGVVDTTFDDKVRQHATTEMQVTAAQMQKQYEEIRRELDVLNKQRGDDQRRIEKLGQDNAALAEQVKALGANPVTATGEPVPQMPASPPGPEGEPQPGNTPVSFPPQGSVAVPPPTAFYPGNGVTPPPQVTYQSVPVPNRIQRKVFTRNEGKQGPSLPYIPSGSFAKAMLIEGADANASVTGNESTVPMQLRITGLVEMPNSKTYDATGCFVGLEAWGDVSSERAIVRTGEIVDAHYSWSRTYLQKSVPMTITVLGKGFISSTTIPVFKYLVDPQMLGVSNSMIYQLTDYIGYDILLQYIQELIQQARAMVATGNYDEAVIGHINDNMNDATRQIAAFQSQVQVQQDALLVVDRQMSYMRQQLSARMLSRYQNNYHFGGSTR